MAILLCQLLLLFSETLLPAERPLRHSGDILSCMSPTGWLQAARMDWRGEGGYWGRGSVGLPPCKHSLLVNWRALIREKIVLASLFFSLLVFLFQPQPAFQKYPVHVDCGPPYYYNRLAPKQGPEKGGKILMDRHLVLSSRRRKE
jgi:hypothetical protein